MRWGSQETGHQFSLSMVYYIYYLQIFLKITRTRLNVKEIVNYIEDTHLDMSTEVTGYSSIL